MLVQNKFSLRGLWKVIKKVAQIAFPVQYAAAEALFNAIDGGGSGSPDNSPGVRVDTFVDTWNFDQPQARDSYTFQELDIVDDTLTDEEILAKYKLLMQQLSSSDRLLLAQQVYAETGVNILEDLPVADKKGSNWLTWVCIGLGFLVVRRSS